MGASASMSENLQPIGLGFALLRARHEWLRHDCAADKYDKFPSPHGFARAEDTIGQEKNITFWIDSS